MSDKYYDSQFTGLEIDEEIRYVKEVARNKIEEHSKALSEKADNKLVVKYSEKNQPNGYLGLDKNGKIDASLLPDDYRPEVDLDNYYTKEEVDEKIEDIEAGSSGVLAATIENNCLVLTQDLNDIEFPVAEEVAY